MRYFVELSNEAKVDIKDALDYYSDLSNSLKDRFQNELTQSIEILFKNPLHYQIRYKNIRIIFTNVFPYAIHYIVENEYVYILKVLHTKRFYK